MMKPAIINVSTGEIIEMPTPSEAARNGWIGGIVRDENPRFEMDIITFLRLMEAENEG